MKRSSVIVILTVALLIWVGFNINYEKKAVAVAAKQDKQNEDEVASNLVADKSAPRPDSLAPPFSLKSLDGKIYNIGGSRDKPLLLNFWASWCGPCEEEAPLLTNLYNKYKDELDLYAVNLTAEDRVKDAEAFAKSFSFSFPVLLDTKGETAALYRIFGIPTSFLIDRSGRIVEVVHILDEKDWEIKLNKLVDG